MSAATAAAFLQNPHFQPCQNMSKDMYFKRWLFGVLDTKEPSLVMSYFKNIICVLKAINYSFSLSLFINMRMMLLFQPLRQYN